METFGKMKNSTDYNDLLDQCCKALDARSDYHLAQLMELDRAVISEFRSGKRRPNTYACTRIAQALGRDPMEIIAMVEAESAKNEAQREFWRSFKFCGMRSSLGLLLSGTLVFFGAGLQAGNAEAAISADSHNVYYVKTQGVYLQAFASLGHVAFLRPPGF